MKFLMKSVLTIAGFMTKKNLPAMTLLIACDGQ